MPRSANSSTAKAKPRAQAPRARAKRPRPTTTSVTSPSAASAQIGTSGAVLDQVKGVGTSFTQGGVSLSQILGVLGVPAGSLLGTGVTANTTIGDNFSLLVQALQLELLLQE